MPTLDLPEKYLHTLHELLDQYVAEAEVWAYGSRVNGNAHAASDLDLVVRNAADPGVRVPHVQELRQALTESDIPIHVDVLEWADIPDKPCVEIEKNYVLLKNAAGDFIINGPL